MMLMYALDSLFGWICNFFHSITIIITLLSFFYSLLSIIIIIVILLLLYYYCYYLLLLCWRWFCILPFYAHHVSWLLYVS